MSSNTEITILRPKQLFILTVRAQWSPRRLASERPKFHLQHLPGNQHADSSFVFSSCEGADSLYTSNMHLRRVFASGYIRIYNITNVLGSCTEKTEV